MPAKVKTSVKPEPYTKPGTKPEPDIKPEPGETKGEVSRSAPLQGLRRELTRETFEELAALQCEIPEILGYAGLREEELADWARREYGIPLDQVLFMLRQDGLIAIRRAGFEQLKKSATIIQQQFNRFLSGRGEDQAEDARRLARDVVKARATRRIETTADLLQIANAQHAPANAKKDLARLYQALRIEVNHEMDALRDMLLGATRLIGEGGRLSVITYHSLEDRIVKNVLKAGNAEGRVEQDFYGRTSSPFRPIGKVVTPSDDEQQRNPRSRSAKLRVGEKVRTQF